MRHRLEAAGFFLLMGLFRLMGLETASKFGGSFARLVGPLTGVEKRAQRNFDLCLPDLSTHERRVLLDKMWSNLGATVAEYAHLDKFSTYDTDSRVSIDGAEYIEQVKNSGKGAIFVSGHFANWELLPLAASGLGLSGGEVYRATNNPYVNKWLAKQRSTYIYQDQIPKGAEGARELIRVLKANRFIVMLIDQKMNDGIAVPLFGHTAMSPPAAAQLALKFGVPIMRASITRQPGARFHITMLDPLWVKSTGDKSKDIATAMTQLNQWLEEEIRSHPHEWLWLHNRFPKDARAGDAPLQGDAALSES